MDILVVVGTGGNYDDVELVGRDGGAGEEHAEARCCLVLSEHAEASLRRCACLRYIMCISMGMDMCVRVS